MMVAQEAKINQLPREVQQAMAETVQHERPMIEAAVKPGGYADQFVMAIEWATWAYTYARVAAALPPIELLLALILTMFSCGAPLAQWLNTDAIISLITVAV